MKTHNVARPPTVQSPAAVTYTALAGSSMELQQRCGFSYVAIHTRGSPNSIAAPTGTHIMEHRLGEKSTD